MYPLMEGRLFAAFKKCSSSKIYVASLKHFDNLPRDFLRPVHHQQQSWRHSEFHLERLPKHCLCQRAAEGAVPAATQFFRANVRFCFFNSILDLNKTFFFSVSQLDSLFHYLNLCYVVRNVKKIASNLCFHNQMEKLCDTLHPNFRLF